LLPHYFSKRTVFLDVPVDVGAMVEVVSQGCVHVGQGEVVLDGYLVGSSAQALVPDNDVANRDPMAGNPRANAVLARRQLNVIV
jgi:hypothetical protein